MHKAIYCAALTAMAALAGCEGPSSSQVAAAPPTVSYRVAGGNLAQANADAGRYCGQYGMAAQLNGTTPDGYNAVANYSCVGGTTGVVYNANQGYYPSSYQPAPAYQPAPTYNAPVYGSSVRCADFLHQGWPGGSDYNGPPVPGCE
jgi:hypothetical protein